MDSDFWRSRRLVDAEAATDHIRDGEEFNRYAKHILTANAPVSRGAFEMWKNKTFDAIALPLLAMEKNFDEAGYREYAKALLGQAQSQSDKLVFGGTISVGKCCKRERIDELVAFNAKLVSIIDEAGYDFIYIADVENLENGRAAVLAAREVTDKPVIVSVLCDEKGEVGDAETLAAMSVFEGLGASAFGVSSRVDPDIVIEQIRELYPFAKIPLFAKLDSFVGEDWEEREVLSPGTFGSYVREALESGATHVFMGGGAHEEYGDMAKIELTNAMEYSCETEKEETPLIATCCNKAHFLDPLVEISDPIYITEDFAEDILEKENEGYHALKVYFAEADDFELFMENVYMFSLPLCISANNLALYERAAMLYPGRAIYDGTLEFEDREAFDTVLNKYGVILL